MFEYINIFIYFIISLILVGLLYFISLNINKINYFLGCGKPVECGSHSFGSGKNKYEIKFILVAILFILFEVELVIFLPWCLVWYKAILISSKTMYLFLVIILLGLLVEFRKETIDTVN